MGLNGTMPAPKKTSLKKSNMGSLPPQRVLIVPDKFKGTLTADEAAGAIERGLRENWPNTVFTRVALTDGGEGFARALVGATSGQLHRAKTVDAIGRSCTAVWGVLGDGETAVLDLASASATQK